MPDSQVRLVIDAEAEQVFIDGKRLRRTEQRYWLYALLAIARLRRDDGWVHPDQIWQLQSWQGNTLDSVGKALAREMGGAAQRQKTRAGSTAAIAYPRVIEAEAGSRVGPYRIQFSPDEIRIDPSVDYLETRIARATVPQPMSDADFKRFLVYARNQVLGIHRFDRGQYDEALRLFETALKDAATPLRRLPVLLAISRFHLGRRRYDKAAKVQTEIERLLPHVHGFDIWGRASVALQRGHSLYSQFRHSEARTQFQLAITLAERTFDYGILAEAYEGMGLAIMADDSELVHVNQAEAYFQRALELSVVAGLDYQVQQSLRSIGVAYYRRADAEWEHGRETRALPLYKKAKRHIEDAVALGEEFRLGPGDGEAQLQLANLCGRLNEMDEAKRWATTAREIALRTGDGKLAIKATRIIALLTEDDDTAGKLLNETIARVDSRFLKYLGKDIIKEFGPLLNLPPEAKMSVIDYSKPATE